MTSPGEINGQIKKLMLFFFNLLITHNIISVETPMIPQLETIDSTDSEDEVEGKKEKKVRPIGSLMEDLERSIQQSDESSDTSGIKFESLKSIKSCVTKAKQCERKLNNNHHNKLRICAIYGQVLSLVKPMLRKSGKKFESWVNSELQINPRTARSYMMFYSIFKAKHEVLYSNLPFRWFFRHGSRIKRELERK